MFATHNVFQTEQMDSQKLLDLYKAFQGSTTITGNFGGVLSVVDNKMNFVATLAQAFRHHPGLKNTNCNF